MKLREKLKKLTKKELLDNLSIFEIKMPQSALKDKMIEGVAGFVQNKENKDVVEKIERKAKLVKAIVNFYGVISLEDIRMVLEKSLKSSIEAEELENFINNFYMIKGKLSYNEEKKLYTSLNVQDEQLDKIIEEINKMKTLHYNILPLSELLRYSDRNYLGKLSGMERIEKLIGEKRFARLIVDTKNDNVPADIFKNIFSEITTETKEQAQQLADEIMKFMNNIYLWVLKGHSPNEIMRNFKEKKIGRNDPCKCGSGKKYKKCCG
ncbi:SEC-C domain-containing protein [Cetobacterium sp. 2A]|uniref:YecA family protein n=1 Tax=Cetobacterium sp. 2A TaxID=2754723 RepID=UPI00163B8FBD|nr:SEC-C metal-binding domain-containing protein [Cetobacterium sp. 2A]MBC2856137.1 SEC-C domain-containing protein [Cetobacterium sp. 2A]